MFQKRQYPYLLPFDIFGAIVICSQIYVFSILMFKPTPSGSAKPSIFFKMVFAHGSAIKVLTGIRMLMVITSQIGSTLSVIQSVLSDDEGRQQQVGSGNI